MRIAISFLILLITIPVYSQKLTGTWVMAYLKAKQPLFTMVEQNGEMVLDESVEADSTITYTAGLMSLKVTNEQSGVSYSWDGEEIWDIKRKNNQIWFYGPADTLYGNFDETESLVLKSTLDEIPTEYVFQRIDFNRKNPSLNLINTSWKIGGDDSYLNKLSLNFQPDSVLISIYENHSEAREYYIHPLNEQHAIEFVVKTAETTQIGIIYLTKIRRKKIEGVFFPYYEAEIAPKKINLIFKKLK